MRKINNVTVIDLIWEGPLNNAAVKEFNSSHDKGIYQIYGTHAIAGPDTLLYIGRTIDDSFGNRVHAGHKEWIDWESADTSIYVGRLAGIEPMTEARRLEWDEMIVRAEALLIYYCTPSYNSYGIANLPKCEATVVLNFKRHHRLPYVISNLYDETPIWDYKTFA